MVFRRRRSRPHVALIIESSIEYGRGVLRGIARYLREHGATWPSDQEVRLVQKGGCWRPYRWEAVPTEADSARRTKVR